MALFSKKNIQGPKGSELEAVIGMGIAPYLQHPEQHYRWFSIPHKRSKRAYLRQPREIQAPSEGLQYVQQLLLHRVLAPIPPHDAATAYWKGRSIIKNARPHRRCEWLFKTDISDFFGTISTRMVAHMLEKQLPILSAQARQEILTLVMFNGFLPQGAPTSPHIANLVMKPLDTAIQDAAEALHPDYRMVAYTRYADDISISGRQQEHVAAVAAFAKTSIEMQGFSLNTRKTVTIGPGRPKIITGLDVSSEILRPPRTFRKKTTMLVRACVANPKGMCMHMPRVGGYLAFWKSITPRDRELQKLFQKFKTVEELGRRLAKEKVEAKWFGGQQS